MKFTGIKQLWEDFWENDIPKAWNNIIPVLFNGYADENTHDMVDHGITAIWFEGVKETRDIFKTELNSIFNAEHDINGLHTIFICSYENFKIYVEAIYLLVFEGTCVFAYSTKMLTSNVNDKLEFVNAEMNASSKSNFLDSMYFMDAKDDSLEYLTDIADSHGNLYSLFSLVYKKPKNLLIEKLNNDHISFENISISESHFVDIAKEYNGYLFDKYKNQINTAIQKQQPYEGMDANPFANEFYDTIYAKNEGTEYTIPKNSIQTKSKRLGTESTEK